MAIEKLKQLTLKKLVKDRNKTKADLNKEDLEDEAKNKKKF